MQFENNEKILEIEEIKKIYELNDNQEEELGGEIKKIEKDMQLSTMSLEQCKKWEKDMNLLSQDDDTIEEKRLKISAVENETTPYTLRSLKKRIEATIGKNRINLKIKDKTLYARIALKSKKSLEFVQNLLEEIVPLNMMISTDVMWNSNSDLRKMTHKEMSQFKQLQLREEVLQEGEDDD